MNITRNNIIVLTVSAVLYAVAMRGGSMLIEIYVLNVDAPVLPIVLLEQI